MAKYLPHIFLLLVLARLIYTVHGVSLRNVSDSALSTDIPISNDSASTASNDRSLTIPPKYSTHPLINKPLMLYLLLTFIISAILYCLIIGYLNSQSVVNHCVLLYLYKDIMITVMVTYSLWFLATVLIYASANGHGINESLAKMICSVIWSGLILELVLMNLAAAFKLYTLMKMAVDPPMPWGDDEQTGIRILRVFSGGLVLIFSTTMYGFGMYPPFYHTFIGNNAPVSSPPKGTETFLILFIFLTITFTVLALGATYYQSKYQQNIEAGAPLPFMQFKSILLVGLAFDLLFAILIFFVPFSRYKFYFISGLYVPLGNIIMPLFIILKIKQMKSYVTRTFHDTIHYALYLNVKFVILCLCIYVFIALCVS